MKLKEMQLFYLVFKLTKTFALPRTCTRWKTNRGIGINFFLLITRLMLLRIFSEALMSVTNTTTKLSQKAVHHQNTFDSH